MINYKIIIIIFILIFILVNKKEYFYTNRRFPLQNPNLKPNPHKPNFRVPNYDE